MQKLRAEELWAASCVRATLPAVVIGQHDDNTSPNTHDFDLAVQGGRTFAALEVTAAVDPELLKFWKVLDGRGKRWIEPSIAGGWAVSVRPDASVKKLRAELPGFLGALEQVPPLYGRDILDTDPGFAKIADSLGVLGAHQAGTNYPGSIYVMPELPTERTGGCVPQTGDALSTWIGEWTACPSRLDNLTKLARAAAVEHHLFVIVAGLAGTAPFEVNDILMRPGAPPPAVAPNLPDEVTHVWVMSTWSGGRGFRWSPDAGWGTFANDADIDAAAVLGCLC
ncbi:hypothetical protein [Actinoplanes sp. DH11]|uniref:hypothetical protein n=1 Tax=Actinoplanes sp. DH11 TaxID=2857011 RepID=UPI001E40FBB3|nr:hypothetical protein [Actinoplanes sp. DH11]